MIPAIPPEYIALMVASARATLMILLLVIAFTAVRFWTRVTFLALLIFAVLAAYSENLVHSNLELFGAYLTCILVIAAGWSLGREGANRRSTDRHDEP